jgi:hypothetical protein
MPVTEFFRRAIATAAVCLVAAASVASAQDSPSPTVTPSATESATPSSSAASATPTPTPTAAASTRSVRISFVPPPLEGTISLGIYDTNDKLVRSLVREGNVDEFDVGADALITKWDGRNDTGEDLPAGKYRARGYMVGRLKAQDIGKAATPPAANATDRVQVKLVSNPLSKDARLQIDLAVAYEDEQIVLKTADGLALFSVIESPPLTRVLATKTGEKAIDVWADGGTAIEQVRVSNIDQMMAFDCGEIELK